MWTANSGQSDLSRVGSPGTPDGIGDACQCFDVSDDGWGDLVDTVLYRRFLQGLGPGLAAPTKCPGAGPGACDAADVATLRDVIAGRSPAPANQCRASGACTSNADCPTGSECNLANQQCAKAQTQACTDPVECPSGACCSGICRDPSMATNTRPGESLGTHLADSATGEECIRNSCSQVLTRTGSHSRYFTLTAQETSLECDAYVSMRLDLEMGLDVDFDLYVTGACFCWPDSCTSENGVGETDSIQIWCEDNPGIDDSFTADIEVVYFSGEEFCQDWTLSVSAGDCAPSPLP
jgi:hypothetical protein